MKRKLAHCYLQIIGTDNLLPAWQEFIVGKKDKRDVQKFALNLMDNIFSLHIELNNFTYRHQGYQAFIICDPKPRNIHKASVRDRLVHHAVYRILYPFFDRTFADDSYSCRNKKGTHKAVNKLRYYFLKSSRNNTRTCYCLKMDIKKFFANIDHEILLRILREHIADKDCLWLLENIIRSFHGKEGIGLPLGNLTSQLLVNVYMNEFDQFVKHRLKEQYFIRYADDFLILSDSFKHLKSLTPKIESFLKDRLRLDIHPNKISIRTIVSGVDYLGFVNFPDHRILRSRTKKRMFKKLEIKLEELDQGFISQETFNQTYQSYLGLLKHCNSCEIKSKFTAPYF